jgi:hypothetical protein
MFKELNYLTNRTVLLQHLPQTLYLLRHIMTTLNLAHVSIQIRYYCPQKTKHFWLLKITLLYHVCLRQNFPILLTQVTYIILSCCKFLQSVN